MSEKRRDEGRHGSRPHRDERREPQDRDRGNWDDLSKKRKRHWRDNGIEEIDHGGPSAGGGAKSGEPLPPPGLDVPPRVELSGEDDGEQPH